MSPDRGQAEVVTFSWNHVKSLCGWQLSLRDHLPGFTAWVSHCHGAVTEARPNAEGIHLGTQSCPLCGNETPKGHRYCRDCDAAGSYAISDDNGGRRAPPARRGGSSLPLVLLFFVLSAFGTVMAGIFAPSALPLLGEIAAPTAVDWGEIRIARVTSNIRAEASASSQIVGKLFVGDSVRVEPVAGGWYEVFSAPLVRRSQAKPLGFVFGKLLQPAHVELVRDSAPPPTTGARRNPAPSTEPPSRRSSGRGS